MYIEFNQKHGVCIWTAVSLWRSATQVSDAQKPLQEQNKSKLFTHTNGICSFFSCNGFCASDSCGKLQIRNFLLLFWERYNSLHWEWVIITDPNWQEKSLKIWNATLSEISNIEKGIKGRYKSQTQCNVLKEKKNKKRTASSYKSPQ